MFQNIADLLGKSLGYPGCHFGLPPLKLVKVDLGICKDRALGTCHWRCDGSPWAVKTGRKRQVERVELVEPTGTGRNSPRKACEPTKYEDI